MEYMVINARRIPGHKEELQPLRDGHRAVRPPPGLPVIPLSPFNLRSDSRILVSKKEESRVAPRGCKSVANLINWWIAFLIPYSGLNRMRNFKCSKFCDTFIYLLAPPWKKKEVSSITANPRSFREEQNGTDWLSVTFTRRRSLPSQMLIHLRNRITDETCQSRID